METVYMDNASTTRVDRRVLDEMMPYFTERYAVPTSIFSYKMGIESREAMERSRKIIAEKINCNPDEIIFTSGGTESNNMALLGIARKNAKKGKHIIASRLEHLSVSKALQKLSDEGFSIDYVPNDENGFIDIKKLQEMIKPETIIVSIHHANDEIGVIQDIEKIGEICSENGIMFHVDACQTFTKVPIDVKKMNINSMSISAHKIHGPKGVGALFLMKGTKTKKIMFGGFNEFDMRPGTENIPAIVGFGKAVEIADKNDCIKMAELRDYMIKKITDEIPKTKINGPSGNNRLCNNVNISFHYVEGESILLRLDMKDICVSTGSACFSRSLEMSPTMKAIGNDHELSHGSIRFSLSKFTTKKEIDYVVNELKRIVEELRKISPLGKE